MEISLHTLLWMLACLFLLAVAITTMRKRQMQRASALFEESGTMNPVSIEAMIAKEENVGRYGDQVVGKPREVVVQVEPSVILKEKSAPIAVMYVMAKPDAQFAGYDLQQSLANASLVHGDMDIYHRYEYPEGDGRLLFSVASAVEPGTIDVANMGTYSTQGLCLFLDCHQHPFPMQSFTLMIHVAKQLADELEGVLLDAKRQPWTKVTEDHLRDKIQRWVA